MSNLFIEDFRYAGFWVSRYNLQDYLMNVRGGRTLSHRRYDYCTYGIVESIINCMATNNVEFNVKDHEICRLLEQLIRAGGYDEHGVYSQAAHQAMHNLCVMQGKNPADHVLYNKNISGRFGQVKTKIKSLFGIGKKKEQEPQKSADKPNKNKILYRISATLTGVAAVGAVMLMTGDKTGTATQADVARGSVPTFKTITVGDTTHSSTQVYNLDRCFYPRAQAARSPFTQHIDRMAKSVNAAAPVATDSASVRLTRASESALNILLGQRKAAELCRQVQAQIDAGIFAAPRGMSVPRIAHAMTMSRIYEGKSVILDALKSKVRLTPAQQAAFEQHIDEIGDLGVKLQRRMASGQRLSTHSRYDHASRALQTAHIKNLKQLNQLRKMAHTR